MNYFEKTERKIDEKKNENWKQRGTKSKKPHKMINQIALKEGYKHTL